MKLSHDYSPPLGWFRALLLGVIGTGIMIAPGRTSAQNIACEFKSTGVSGGGRFISIAANPYNVSQLLAATETALFRSIDKGVTWKQVPHNTSTTAQDGFIPLPQTTLQWVANDAASSRVYATRRLSLSSNVSRPCLSTDGGASWTDLPLPAAPSDPNRYLRIFAENGNSSSNAATQLLILENHRKLWFSRNGGTTWTLIHQHTPGVGALGTVGSPADSIRVAGVYFANGNETEITTNLGVIQTLNNAPTNGSAPVWSSLPSTGLPIGSQILSLAFVKPSRLGVTCVTGNRAVVGSTTFIEMDQDDAWNRSGITAGTYRYSGCYTAPRMPNSQYDWTARPGPAGAVLTQLGTPATIDASVFAITSSLSAEPAVFETRDAGVTWTSKFIMANNQNMVTGQQGDGGSLNWSSTKPSLTLAAVPWAALPELSTPAPTHRLLIGGSHPYLSQNSGVNWTQMSVKPADANPAGAAIARPKQYQPTGLNSGSTTAVHWLSADRVLIGSLGMGLQVSLDGGTKWTLDYNPLTPSGGNLAWPNWYGFAQRTGADPVFAAVAAAGGDTVYETGRLSDAALAASGLGNVLSSTDQGVTWSALGPVTGTFPGPVVAVAADAWNTSRVYACVATPSTNTAGGIYRSPDGGLSWILLPAHARTERRPQSVEAIGANTLLATYSGRTNSSGLHTQSSGVFLSVDGGDSWADVTAADMKLLTRGVTPAPPLAGESASSRWFAAVESETSSSTKGGVYRTTDSGSTWVKVFPHAAVRSVTLSRGTQPVLYVATANDSVWFSTNPFDGAPTFSRLNNLLHFGARGVWMNPTRADASMWVTTAGGGTWIGQEVDDSTMVARLVKNPSNPLALDFQIDITDTGTITAPTLRATLALTSSGCVWSEITSATIAPVATTPGGIVTKRYTWPQVDMAAFFTGSSKGFLQATRMRSDGLPEASDVGGWMSEVINALNMRV
jgi:hypothetical protein